MTHICYDSNTRDNPKKMYMIHTHNSKKNVFFKTNVLFAL